MIDLGKDVQSLTEFKRETGKHIRRMKRTGSALVLTVNGRAEVVVQDATSYQKLLERAARADAIDAIRDGLASMRRGEGKPIEEVLEKVRRKYNIPRDK